MAAISDDSRFVNDDKMPPLIAAMSSSYDGIFSVKTWA